MVLFRHANDVLKNETTMFEKFLKRVDPKDIGLQQASKLLKNFVSLPPIFDYSLVFDTGEGVSDYFKQCYMLKSC